MAKELTTDLKELSLAVEELTCALKEEPGDHLKELSLAVEELTCALKGELYEDHLIDAANEVEQVLLFGPLGALLVTGKLEDRHRLTKAIDEVEYYLISFWHWQKEMELDNKKTPQWPW